MKRLVSLLAVLLLPLVALARPLLIPPKHIKTSDPGIATSGRSGVLMYRTSADLWSWIAYQS